MAKDYSIIQGAAGGIIVQPTWGTLDGAGGEQGGSGIDIKAIATDIEALLRDDFYTRQEIDSMLVWKQDTLTFDTIPALNSSNPVTSGGIFTALSGKADTEHTHAAGDITSGTLPITRGGTGAADAENARKNLGYLGMYFAEGASSSECILIPDNSDLNTPVFCSTGKYYIQLSASAGTLTNCPTNEAFQMLVYNLLDNQTGEMTLPWESRTRILMNYLGQQWVQNVIKRGNNYSYSTWNRINEGTVPIERGGTGAITAASALTNLGAAPANHTHSNYTLTTVQPNDNSAVITRRRVIYRGASGSVIQYFKVAEFPVYDDNGNAASVILTGRIGGWVSSNLGYITAVISNRGGASISVSMIEGTGTAESSIYNYVDLVLSYNSSTRKHTLYLKCTSWFAFDLNIEAYDWLGGITYLYDGSYTTTAPDETVKASTSTNRMTLANGKLFVNGVQK